MEQLKRIYHLSLLLTQQNTWLTQVQMSALQIREQSECTQMLEDNAVLLELVFMVL